MEFCELEKRDIIHFKLEISRQIGISIKHGVISLNFQCPYCVSKFSQKHNLKTHIQQKHDENFENILNGHMKLHLHGVKEDVNKKQDDMPRETEVDLSKNMDVSDSGILLCKMSRMRVRYQGRE